MFLIDQFRISFQAESKLVKLVWFQAGETSSISKLVKPQQIHPFQKMNFSQLELQAHKSPDFIVSDVTTPFFFLPISSMDY